ncbi:P-loop containing nucleoside triphosphate hydrolase protein, partial [Jimgerdemannia flammicorona]
FFFCTWCELYSAYFRFLRLKFYRNWPNFRDGIVKPLIRDKEGTLRKVQTILRGVLLRRTKFSILDGRPILALPPRTVDYERGDFLSRERALYTTLEERSQDKFRRAMRAGRVMRRYVFFLTLLLRMRQACDHPALVPKELWEEGEGENEEDLMVGDVKEAEAELEKARRVFPKEVVDRLLVKYGGMRMGMVDREPGKERERGGQAVVNEEQEPLAGEEAEEGDGECPICFDAADSPVVTRCGHMYCKDCILNVIYTDRQVDVVDVEDRRCPLCRGVIKEDELIPLAAFQPPRVVAPVEQPEEINDYDYDDDDDEEELPSLESLLPKPKPEAGAETDAGPSTAGPSTAGPSTTGPSTAPKKSMIERDLWDPLVSSTKIEMLMEMLSQGSAEDPGCKTIVFSQFTKMLDIVEHYLRDKAIKFCRYDGKMTARDQEAAVRQLTDDPRTTVMLGSLKCAGLGLNLTIANRVIIIDPWWNPACEDQAIDRVHRIGQEKGVIVKRLTIKDTVEDRMIALQEKKEGRGLG